MTRKTVWLAIGCMMLVGCAAAPSATPSGATYRVLGGTTTPPAEAPVDTGCGLGVSCGDDDPHYWGNSFKDQYYGKDKLKSMWEVGFPGPHSLMPDCGSCEAPAPMPTAAPTEAPHTKGPAPEPTAAPTEAPTHTK